MKNKIIMLSALCVASVSAYAALTPVTPSQDQKNPANITGNAYEGAYSLSAGFYQWYAGTTAVAFTNIVVDSGEGVTDIFLKSSSGNRNWFDIKSNEDKEALNVTGTLRFGSTYMNPSSESLNLTVTNTTGTGTTIFTVDNFLLQKIGWNNTTNPVDAKLTMNVESNLTVNVRESFQILENKWDSQSDGYNNPSPTLLNVTGTESKATTMKLVDNSGNGSANFVLRGRVGDGYTSSGEVATVTVDKYSTLDMGLVATIGGTTTKGNDAQGKMDIAGTLIVGKAMTFEKGGTLELDAGTLQLKDKVTFKEGSTFDVNGASTIISTSGAIDIKAGASFNVNTDASVEIDGAVLTIADTATTIVDGTLIVNGGGTLASPKQFGKLEVNGILDLKGGMIQASGIDTTNFTLYGTLKDSSAGNGGIAVLDGKTVILAENSKVESGRIAVRGGGTLKIDGPTLGIASIVAYAEIDTNKQALIDVTGANTISKLYISHSSTEVVLDVADLGSELLTITSLQGEGSLSVLGFVKDTTQIAIGEAAAFSAVDTIKLYGDTLTDKDFLGFGKLENGYLVLAVPEPAEWAAIFGAIALAFAIYRRKRA